MSMPGDGEGGRRVARECTDFVGMSGPLGPVWFFAGLDMSSRGQRSRRANASSRESRFDLSNMAPTTVQTACSWGQSFLQRGSSPPQIHRSTNLSDVR